MSLSATSLYLNTFCLWRLCSDWFWDTDRLMVSKARTRHPIFMRKKQTSKRSSSLRDRSGRTFQGWSENAAVLSGCNSTIFIEPWVTILCWADRVSCTGFFFWQSHRIGRHHFTRHLHSSECFRAFLEIVRGPYLWGGLYKSTMGTHIFKQSVGAYDKGEPCNSYSG